MFLPKPRSTDGAIRIILRNAFAITLQPPTPEWANTIVAPGQAELDRQIVTCSEQIAALVSRRDGLIQHRTAVRGPVRVLYSFGEELEEEVREKTQRRETMPFPFDVAYDFKRGTTRQKGNITFFGGLTTLGRSTWA